MTESIPLNPLEQAARGGGAVSISGSVQEKGKYGTEGRGLVAVGVKS